MKRKYLILFGIGAGLAIIQLALKSGNLKDLVVGFSWSFIAWGILADIADGLMIIKNRKEITNVNTKTVEFNLPKGTPPARKLIVHPPKKDNNTAPKVTKSKGVKK